MTTLKEVEEWWSVDDLADAHDALDIEIEMRDLISEAEMSRMPKAKGAK